MIYSVSFMIEVQYNYQVLNTEQLIICFSYASPFYQLNYSINQFQQQSYSNRKIFVFYEDYFVQRYFNVNIITQFQLNSEIKDEWSQVNFIKIDIGDNIDEIKKKIIQLLNANYYCEWDLFAYNDMNRLSLQINELQNSGAYESRLESIQVLNSVNKYAYTMQDEVYGINCTSIYQVFHKDKNIVITRQPNLYVRLKDDNTWQYAKNFVNESIYNKIQNQVGPKQIFDSVINLGTYCQMGEALEIYQLSNQPSPFNRLGFRQWNGLVSVLWNNFSTYWQLQNMVIGKVRSEYSEQQKELLFYKVYCNVNKMVSVHDFLVSENSPTELLSYNKFRNELDNRIQTFNQQMEQKSVLFCVKILSKQEENTIVRKKDIINLYQAIQRLRRNKQFKIRASVPQMFEQLVRQWIQEENLTNFEVAYGWTEPWNNPLQYMRDSAEWDHMLGDIGLASDFSS
ncbi:Conserved_hypothetical protein [Hexamita inflata]|uniref:Uncharacterized protein n=1 Tax=Hexamita inflata TaxID=28002 RepID=A0AA86Q217_9EUKA|nr:Conserved hypothetical protein [Hexamita inflata]